MIGPCPYLCDNKTSAGYCKSTACTHLKYKKLYNAAPTQSRTYTVGQTILVPNPVLNDKTTYHVKKD